MMVMQTQIHCGRLSTQHALHAVDANKTCTLAPDDEKHDGKNKAHHVKMLQMRLREIVQVEITEEQAVLLLNKAAPTTLTSYQYQPSDIDNAVAAYFDQA
jgi:hypothetical protein